MNNQHTFSSAQVIDTYVGNLKLQKAEEYIFDKYRSYIDKGRILDVGIGAGRTTHHLAKRAAEYIGIDFSEGFVNHSKEAYEGRSVRIEWADARDLSGYQDEYFDFVLFSFNGIDYVDISDREKILSGFHRVLRYNGILCFSFHNSRNIDQLYSFQMPRNPLKYYWEWQRCKKIRSLNGLKDVYADEDHFCIYDGGEDFNLLTLYIKPEFQKKQLESLGFKVLHLYEAITAKQLTDKDLKLTRSPWIYATAQKTGER